MQKLSSGRFQIQIAGETKEVVISLGLKSELYKLITKSQMDMAALQSRVYMDKDLAEKITAQHEKVKQLEAEEAGAEILEAAQEELDFLYGEALADIETRQKQKLDELVIQKLDLSEQVFAECVSCLLSERNEFGKITSKLDVNVIMWSPTYAEAQEELTELLHAVTEYITTALKKISGINKMITETTEAAEKQSLVSQE